MDLASKTEIVEELKKIKEAYREDTEVGQNIREGIDKCIHHIVDAGHNQLFSLRHLGESDLIELLKDVNINLDKLTAEPEISVFKIQGFYPRYTTCHEKAKDILKEEFVLMLDNIDDDYADFKLDIQMESIKQSNLKDYKIES